MDLQSRSDETWNVSASSAERLISGMVSVLQSLNTVCSAISDKIKRHKALLERGMP